MRLILAAVLSATLVAAPVRAQQPTTPVTTNAGATYRLSPGDILKVSVFGHDEYTGQFQVDENGKLSFPVIGEIDTRNLTVAEVREKLRQGLSSLFNQPFVAVSPLFRIAVLGDVVKPGLYIVDPTMSVIDVIALAGGPSPTGNLNDIKLIRGGQRHVVNFESQQTQTASLGTIGVRSGDQIFVPGKSFTSATLQIIISIAQLALTAVVLYETVK